MSEQNGREAIARIINPDLFVEYDLLVKQGTIAENGKPWAEVVFGQKIEVLLAKADAILAGVPQWQPIDTAPVEPWDKVPSYYVFRCLLHIPPGHPNNPPEVRQGYGYYVAAPRSTERRILRWNDGHHQCFPKYWMPLPAPRVEA